MVSKKAQRTSSEAAVAFEESAIAAGLPLARTGELRWECIEPGTKSSAIVLSAMDGSCTIEFATFDGGELASVEAIEDTTRRYLSGRFASSKAKGFLAVELNGAFEPRGDHCCEGFLGWCDGPRVHRVVAMVVPRRGGVGWDQIEPLLWAAIGREYPKRWKAKLYDHDPSFTEDRDLWD